MNILSGPGSVPARDLHVGDHVLLGTRAVEITSARPDDALILLGYADAHGHAGACQRGALEPIQLADDLNWSA
jgi:hypothetical protein